MPQGHTDSARPELAQRRNHKLLHESAVRAQQGPNKVAPKGLRHDHILLSEAAQGRLLHAEAMDPQSGHLFV